MVEMEPMNFYSQLYQGECVLVVEFRYHKR